MKEPITSRQNPRVKDVCGLYEKKHRRETGRFRMDGKKLFEEALGHAEKIETVWVSEQANDAVKDAVASALREGKLCEEQLVFASESVFEKITKESSPEGIVTVMFALDDLHRALPKGESLVQTVRSGERLLLAQSLRDAGNLGTILRSGAALGIDRMILTDDCADLYHPKTLRAAMGAIFRLPTLTVSDLPSVIGELRASGRRVFATALREDATPIGELSLTKGDCFVIGNEGHGLDERTIDACSGCAIIPMREGNESLNAAAAATICLWETVRAK